MSRFFSSLFASKPKSKAERFGLKGGVLVVDTPSPVPSVNDAPPEPEHPEDQVLFEGDGHDSIPIRDSDDELGPVPPVPIEVSGGIVDSVAHLDIIPGIQEIRTLMKEVLNHLQGDSKIMAEIKVLESDCEFLFDRMQNLNSTSPELNDEVMRMRKYAPERFLLVMRLTASFRELTNTLAHLNHFGTSPAAKARSRLTILKRTERCRIAVERIQKKLQLVQGTEILNIQQQMLVQQTRTSSSNLQREIQASEEELQRIMRQHTKKIIPREMILSEQIVYRGNTSHSDGKRFNVYKGELMNGEKVAIKISGQNPSLHDDEGRNFGRRILRHATTWQSFDSKYILPFLGMGVEITKAEEPGARDYFRVYFVSPWIPDGDAVNFIRNGHQQGLHVDVAKIVHDVALGLKYLHEMDEPCIHGSLRGENVLIKMDGGIEQGCLNGFALTKRQIRNQPPPALTGEDGICRWKAPEIVDSLSNDPPMDPPSDIWSWAMTALQLYSGLEPYHQHVKDFKICREITSGKTPKREDYPDFDKYAPLPDKTWELFEKCWNMEPEERPKIKDVVDELAKINAEANPDCN
ncbi:unnamed protein product [Rhizoctonia solani]|uniref:Protein kinase domain-containing protein n=1 Tax=Rhizoctonia solani TaxID=456999 RepID=A0A8H2WEB0_9AGAM|nr:unnamed protein product [Rhizoctonia solani]